MEAPKKKSGLSTRIVLLGVAVATFSIAGIISLFPENELFQRKAETKSEDNQKEKDRLAKEQSVDNWYKYSSHYDCEKELKNNLRDPDSYKRDGGFTTLMDNNFEKAVFWKYRARNGFGGYDMQNAMCSITKQDTGTYEVKSLAN
jgi:hypothetical protein